MALHGKKFGSPLIRIRLTVEFISFGFVKFVILLEIMARRLEEREI